MVDRVRVDLVVAAVVLLLLGRYLVNPIASWVINRAPY
jgi:hypothetical protein